MGFRITHQGNWNRTKKFLSKNTSGTVMGIFQKYGDLGVAMLSSFTPKRSGETANSWYYVIEGGSDGMTLSFCNSHINKGVPIAVILQYGHGTGTGGWYGGTDYINPAIRPVFDSLCESLLREVSSD